MVAESYTFWDFIVKYLPVWLQFIAAVILAFITYCYVKLTSTIAKETSKQAKIYEKQLTLFEKQINITYSPFVVVKGSEEIVYNLKMQEKFRYYSTFINVGNSCALNLAFECELVIGDKHLNSLETFRDNYLLPQQTTEFKKSQGFSFPIITSDLMKESKNGIIFRIYYKNLASSYIMNSIFGKLIITKIDNSFEIGHIITHYETISLTQEEFESVIQKDGRIEVIPSNSTT